MSRNLATTVSDAVFRASGFIRRTADLSCGPVSWLFRPGRVEGQTPVVLIHGSMADSKIWSGCARQLDPGLPVIVPDLPGHGCSVASLALRYGVAEQAAWLHELLQRLEVPRAHLVGSSMGGAIAIRYADEHPEQVASLVLMNSAGISDCPGDLHFRILAGDRNPLTEIGSVGDFRDTTHFVMSRLPWSMRLMERGLYRETRDRDAINRKIFEDTGPGFSMEASLPRLAPPVAVVWGEEDRIFSPDCADRFLSLIGKGDKHMLEGVGHLPMLEAPARTAGILNRFVSQRAVGA